MQLHDLSEPEKRIALAAVAAIVAGPFLDDEEFQTVLGFERQELRDIHADMLSGRDDAETTRAIGQSLNNLIGYPHGRALLVEKMVGCRMADLEAFADKWFGKESGYFSRLQ